MESSAPMRLCAEAGRDPADMAVVRVAMRSHTAQYAPVGDYAELTFILRDAGGAPQGAGLGETGRGWLHIGLIWVAAPCRRQGWGARILQAMESEAWRRGCRQAYLDTFSYQARPFYERRGFEVFGTLEDYPPGHKRYFMRKRLQPA